MVEGEEGGVGGGESIPMTSSSPALQVMLGLLLLLLLARPHSTFAHDFPSFLPYSTASTHPPPSPALQLPGARNTCGRADSTGWNSSGSGALLPQPCPH